MTDHPTRRLPENERPDPPPETGPTRRLTPGSGPTPITRTCRRCGGEVARFPAVVQTSQGILPVELENPAGPRDSPGSGRRPHARSYGAVCHDCGYTEWETAGASHLWAE
jgi:hypothetical protein